jgi:hypothetical protein
MTVYEITYKNRLKEMFDQIIQRYGFEHNRTIMFAIYYDKFKDNANYENREFMEKLFKGYMK